MAIAIPTVITWRANRNPPPHGPRLTSSVRFSASRVADHLPCGMFCRPRAVTAIWSPPGRAACCLLLSGPPAPSHYPNVAAHILSSLRRSLLCFDSILRYTLHHITEPRGTEYSPSIRSLPLASILRQSHLSGRGQLQTAFSPAHAHFSFCQMSQYQSVPF